MVMWPMKIQAPTVNQQEKKQNCTDNFNATASAGLLKMPLSKTES